MTGSNTLPPSPLGVIEVRGDDAGTFLRAQLTNDVARLGPDRNFLSAWCDAKGRALMVTRVLVDNDGYLLLLPVDLVDSVLKRLRMFVLRARVTLEDATPRFDIYGMVTDDAPTANRTEARDDHLLLGLPTPSDDRPRALVLAPAGKKRPAGALAVDDHAWALMDIDAGLPELHAATQGLFVPQMLNLHWLLAIDFDKGCYPGQEVIARLHYRGTLTRRLYRMAWSGQMPVAGADVLDGAGERQGTVLQSAGTGDSGRLLAVLKTSAATQPLVCGQTPLERLDLPYATPD
ncbi:CAF17-like 4Fe-4S cluster assembly/insertion protein YgfZ [Salinisphaera aquimarina]|uniref:YgfZ/GcvT domain-containing protein n=1 Tax=Salinisphaera aquimarina TaxID=2094031 RepID=A0ABV7EP68_9GAMM